MSSRGFFVFGFWRFLAIGLAPVLVLGFYVGLRLWDAQRQTTDLQATVLANGIEARVEEVVVGYEVAFSQTQHLAPGLEHRALLELTLAEHMPNVESLLFVGPDERTVEAVLGDDVSASADDFVGLDMSNDRTYQRAHESGEPAWSGVFTSTITGNQVIGVVVPEQRGAVYATLSIDWLTQLIGRVDPPKGVDVAVVGANGDVVYDTEEAVARTHPSWAGITPILRAMRGEVGSYEFELEGERMIGTTAAVAGTGWTILVRQDRAAAMHGQYEARATVAVIVLLVAVLAIGAGLNFSVALSRPVAALARLADDVEHGRPASETVNSSIRELLTLEGSIVSMSHTVRERESDLLESRELLAGEVRDKERALGRLGAMSSELAIAEQRERRRLAEELHDRVSQALAVAGMRLKMAMQDLPDDDSLPIVEELLADAVTQSRIITAELASPILYELGLRAALAETAQTLQAQYGLSIGLELSESAECVNEDVAVTLVRTCRELLTNVVKHASATHAHVALSANESGVTLRVSDDGVGMSGATTENAEGFGLLSIRERLEYVSGVMEIQQRPGGGTVVVVQVPCG